MTTTLTVSAEDPFEAYVADLLRQSDAVAASLYPGEYRRPITPETLAVPDVRVVVARLLGKPAGMCALFFRGDGTVELKRMIVDSEARGIGVGVALIAGAHSEARARGAHTVMLEVGTRNTGAQALYRRSGYELREAFEPYKASPISLFMERRLLP